MRPCSRNVLAQAGQGRFRFQLSAQAFRVKGTTDTAPIQAFCRTRIKSDCHVQYRFHSRRPNSMSSSRTWWSNCSDSREGLCSPLFASTRCFLYRA